MQHQNQLNTSLEKSQQHEWKSLEITIFAFYRPPPRAIFNGVNGTGLKITIFALMIIPLSLIGMQQDAQAQQSPLATLSLLERVIRH